ncbi:MAG: DNA-binding response regulator, partial [Rhodoferax sp.]|nr:DNA-binding response regulator [Rhodoferax sp.]
RLDISIKTVDTHRSQLMKQLEIHEITGLVRYAMRAGLISPD